jgi:hypothetical protein
VKWERTLSPLLGGARLCSPLLSADLHRLAKPQVGGVVVTILTSEGPLVRTQLRPLRGQRVAGSLPDALMTVSTGCRESAHRLGCAASVEVSARFGSAYAALLQAVGAQVGTGLW